MTKGVYADYANISGIVGVVIGRGLATLNELDTVYSLPDALNMLEVVTVQNYNEWAAMEASKDGYRN